jgi:hypothetical protein
MEMNELDELHHFVNDLYERWDEGDISYDDAVKKARLYMRKENHKKYTESVNRILDKFNITEKEFYDRSLASLRNNKYAYPNFVVSYGDRDSYTEVLYFDGDDGRAIISNNCEIFDEEGCKIKLHECNYCDFEWETIQDIFNILQEVEEYADE